MPGPRARRHWPALLRPRWLAWHAFAVLAAAGMLWLGDWQLHRAEAGNELSWAYTFEWPLFAILGAVFWFKTVREELSAPGSGQPKAGGGAAHPAEAGHAELRAPGGADRAGERAAAGPDYAARLRAEVRQHGRWHGLR
jgi:hypothetical protein